MKIQFRKDQVPYVKERIWHPTQTFEDLPTGDTVMTFRAGGEFEIMRWVLGWGSAAQVLEPASFREEFAWNIEWRLSVSSAGSEVARLIVRVGLEAGPPTRISPWRMPDPTSRNWGCTLPRAIGVFYPDRCNALDEAIERIPWIESDRTLRAPMLQGAAVMVKGDQEYDV